MTDNIGIVWFRQDLRIRDNPAFLSACKSHDVVVPIYIYDNVSFQGEAQNWWLHHSLIALDLSLKNHGLSLVLRRGNAIDIIKELLCQLPIQALYWNFCYEPQAIRRDNLIRNYLLQQNIQVKIFNGSLLHKPWEILTQKGEYFKVFTPFWRKCLSTIKPPRFNNITCQIQSIALKTDNINLWQLLPKGTWGEKFSKYWQPGELGAQHNLKIFSENYLSGYKEQRNFPYLNATSKLSPHLHFGEISPWQIFNSIQQAKLFSDCDISSLECFGAELGWREFSAHLLYHFPTLAEDNFRQEFDSFPWETSPQNLAKWQAGMTGYPIVDAGMRELWETGYMHNRVRMIVASFLTKTLLIDWRLGAKWFVNTLLDADLASNSASWQWVAGCGADAAPYFRIFNPILQSIKFDPNGNYIRKWVPELAHIQPKYIHNPWKELNLQAAAYPKFMVDHAVARSKALALYKNLKNSK